MGSEFRVKDRLVGEDHPVYVIGEIACGHQGDPEQAMQLIDAIADAGADAAQLQIFDYRANVAPSAPIYKLLQDISFGRDTWFRLSNHVRQRGLALSLFVYDEPSMELALDLKPDMLKLNSSELSNPVLVVGAAKSGLPFTIGTGSSTFDEIGKALSWIKAEGALDRVVLMHGVQNFPTALEAAEISRVKMLRDVFRLPVIYADHSPGGDPISLSIDMVALGAGACMLEKHLVVDRSKEGVDWQSSLQPAEFATYVANMRMAWTALGDARPRPFNDSDLRYRRFQKKSLVSATALPQGHKLRATDFRFLRVQGEREGISPSDSKAVEGWTLRRPLAENEQIFVTDLIPPARS